MMNNVRGVIHKEEDKDTHTDRQTDRQIRGCI